MLRLALILSASIFVSGALAADSTHSMKSEEGKSIEVTWWESMATCYGRFQAIGQYVEDKSKSDAKALLDYSNIAYNLALKRLMRERSIALADAQNVALPVARQSAQLTAQGFAIYQMTGVVDQKNRELIGSCMAELNDYAKVFPDESNTGQ